LGKLREKIKTRGRSSDENRRLFETVVNSDILRHIREKNWDRVKKTVHDLTGEDIEAES